MKTENRFTEEQAKIQHIVLNIISEIILEKQYLFDEVLINQIINKYDKYILENKLRKDNYRKERIVEYVTKTLEHNYHLGQLFE